MSRGEFETEVENERGASAFTALGLRAEAEPIAPGLHVVATPIGNLRDITLRALATLAAADAVIAEDTRVTRNLLAHYGVSTPLVAYHEHNAAVVRPHLLARLAGGAALALVSDAGTPLVSDPGFRLVIEALEVGVAVTSVPVLIMIGIFMMQSVVEIDMTAFETAAPAVLTIFAIPLTFSIAKGIGIGLICSVLLSVGLGRARSVSPIGYAVALMFFLSFFRI